MRALVTGATGFVGGRLIEPLQEAGHEVRAFVRDAGDYELTSLPRPWSSGPGARASGWSNSSPSDCR